MLEHFTSVACEFSYPLLFTPQKSTAMEVMFLIFHCEPSFLLRARAFTVFSIASKTFKFNQLSYKRKLFCAAIQLQNNCLPLSFSHWIHFVCIVYSFLISSLSNSREKDASSGVTGNFLTKVVYTHSSTPFLFPFWCRCFLFMEMQTTF
jgi:hypothetical protein